MDNSDVKVESKIKTPSTPNGSPKLKTSSLSFLTNWKFLAIVGVFALLAVGGILLLKGLSPAPAEPTPPVIQQSSPPAPQPQTQDTIPPQVRKSFATQGECEAETGKKCDFIMCDYVPPGKTFEEVCGKDFKKGWQATSEPAQVDTSTWQTYRNDEFGFEVTYPGSLHYWYPNATRGKPDTFGVSLLSVVMQQDGGMWSPSVRISVYSAHGYFAPEAIDLLAWISDNAPTNPTGDKSLLSETAESSLDNRWARTASLFSFDATKRIIIAGNGSYIYTISYDESTPNDPLLEEHLKIYEQILSTFRFVEEKEKTPS